MSTIWIGIPQRVEAYDDECMILESMTLLGPPLSPATPRETQEDWVCRGLPSEPAIVRRLLLGD
jgi:hypothetical protein